MNRIATRVVLFVSACLLCSGCVQSRYGIAYEQRMHMIRTVEVVPLRCQVERIHTGGVMEPQPELGRKVCGQLTRELQRLIARKGFEVRVPRSAPRTDPEPLALAVAESIVTHHYLYGKAKTFDYRIGPAAQHLQTTSSDAILCFILKAMVPTEGREGMKAAATVLSIATGAPAYVPTRQITLMLMLIDVRTGKVLWTSVAAGETDITDPGELRKLVERTGQTLREPPK